MFVGVQDWPTALFYYSSQQGFKDEVSNLIQAEQQSRAENVDAVSTTAPFDLNKKNGSGSTALLLAVINELIDVAILLIEAGSDININDSHGYSVLDLAIEKGLQDVAIAIINQGLDFVSPK